MRGVPGEGQEPEADDEQAGYRAAAEGDLHGLVHADGGGLCRADVGPDGDAHADDAGKGGTDGADDEADRGQQAEAELGRGDTDDDGEHDADDGDGLVLAGHVGLGAFLYRAGDLLHLLVASAEGHNPVDTQDTVHDGGPAACERGI